MDKFVVGYSGNLGRAHEFATVLTAAERLRDNQRIVFLMVGGGYHLRELAQSVRERKLDQMFRFVSYQSAEALKYSLCVPYVHWISLRKELEGLIVPSKFYGIAAAGRAMIAITDKDGEIARLLRRYECGLVVEPGQGNDLAQALLKLSSDHELTTTLGHRARTMLDNHFTRRHAFERWRELLDSIT